MKHSLINYVYSVEETLYKAALRAAARPAFFGSYYFVQKLSKYVGRAAANNVQKAALVSV